MNQYKADIKKIIGKFVIECEKSFIKTFELDDLNFGRDLAPNEKTGAMDWCISENGVATANIMISVGCKTRIEAEIEKLSEAIYAPHGIFTLNDDVKRAIELPTAKIQLKGQVATTAVQQTSSRIWVAIVTFQIESFIGL